MLHAQVEKNTAGVISLQASSSAGLEVCRRRNAGVIPGAEDDWCDILHENEYCWDERNESFPCTDIYGALRVRGSYNDVANALASVSFKVPESQQDGLQRGDCARLVSVTIRDFGNSGHCDSRPLEDSKVLVALVVVVAAAAAETTTRRADPVRGVCVVPEFLVCADGWNDCAARALAA